MATLGGLKFIQQSAADARPHVLGFTTPRSTAADTLLEIWNGATNAALVASVDLNGRVILGTATVSAFALADTLVLGTSQKYASAAVTGGYAVHRSFGNQTAATTGNLQALVGSCEASHAAGTVAGLYGAAGTAILSGAGTVTDHRGGSFRSFVNAGVATNAQGADVRVVQAGGVITDAKALYVNIQQTGGAMVNAYGLWIGDITTGTTLNYALYTGAGAVRFGGLVTADAGLTVASGQNLTLTGATVVGAPTWGSTQAMNISGNATTASAIAASGVTAGTFAAGNFAFPGALTIAGTAYIGDTSNANVTLGLTINQGTADNEILSLKSSDIAHGMTSITETDTYGAFSKAAAADGGLVVDGYSANIVATAINGTGTTDNTAKNSAAYGYIALEAYKKSGTGRTTPGADANLVVIGRAGTTCFIFDREGSAHADTEWTVF